MIELVYSISPPNGRPVESLVILTSLFSNCDARKLIVLSPSAEGFKAKIISLISPAFIIFSNWGKLISLGPIPSSGERSSFKIKYLPLNS